MAATVLTTDKETTPDVANEVGPVNETENGVMTAVHLLKDEEVQVENAAINYPDGEVGREVLPQEMSGIVGRDCGCRHGMRVSQGGLRGPGRLQKDAPRVLV